MTPSTSDIAAMTPMMRQYFDLKAYCPDAILFFRMGDFFEIFGTDAEQVAPLLDIALTSRERGDQQRIKFCGVPHHSAKGYWLKLLRKGFKIAVADQVEDAALAKGLVRREITKVLTPGCVDDLEGLESTTPNYLMATYEDPNTQTWALLLTDISTGELRLASLPESEIPHWLETLAPKEILARRFYHPSLQKTLASLQNKALLGPLPEGILHDATQQRALLERVFPNKTLADQPCGAVPGGDALLASVLWHVEQLKMSLEPFRHVQGLRDPETFCLDPVAIRDLELFETLRERSTKASLLAQINFCHSPMGVRLLRWSLQHPFLQAEPIAERHRSVRGFLELDPPRFEAIQGTLKGTADLERLTARLTAGSISPRELTAMRETLRKSLDLAKLCQDASPSIHALVTPLEALRSPYERLERALREEPGQLGEGTQVIRPGWDAQLDIYLHDALHGQDKVEAYQEALRQETGITSLKVKSHKTFGLMIEVTKTHFAKIPTHFVRRQTMVNCERFVTEALLELDEQVSHATRFAVEREALVYEELLQTLGTHKEALFQGAAALAQVDLLFSFAILAQKKNYHPAQFSPDRLSLQAARHPVVEAFVGSSNFVANDIHLHEQEKFQLLTGPNMGGKSTLMRQTALCALLNQIGCFVPAAEAYLPLFDQIYTRVGASDDLSRGLSTFMAEMSETATILRYATGKSLVLLDEVGRGTSTEDGLALAWSIFQDLATRVDAWMLFSTHYHELVPLAQNLPRVQLIQTEVLESSTGVTFTHRVIPGFCSSSFGLEVADLAGIPPSVIAHAKDFLAQHRITPCPSPSAESPLSEAEMPATPHKDAIIARLERVSLNRTTPIQALNVLHELLELLENSEKPAKLRRSIFSNELDA